ncbi:hypothetical protein ASPBRDRAFT_37494 [Aspergillus brasiliensis CBS 101740]|uniref:Uncharacterized protein n=1 Tax=Aspergillus brasiliensis (strain CBS 101740 / IMI 381727 / IBT 21946) TaxID=767769 RepID=A0A1L9V2Y0_ASPBC|nr:hypothetical protein ASPBRDRAFT_37494 [Aspergillus brasiliensis CBS 101740]
MNSNNGTTQFANNEFFSPMNRYFGRKPTSVTSESNVRIGESAMPWEQADESGKVYKYQYHPHGDKSQPLRNAPSALNTVIVPNVTLPVVFTAPLRLQVVDIRDQYSSLPTKSLTIMLFFSLQDLHERYNKYGKEEWDY